MALRPGVGARLTVPDGLDPFVFLFAESTARAVVAVPASAEHQFTAMSEAARQPCARIGDVGTAGGPAVLDFVELFEVALDDLRTAHDTTIPGQLNAVSENR